MLSVKRIEQMRNRQADLLPDSAQLRTRTQTTDGQGGRTDTYTTTVVYCRLRPMSGEQTQRFADQLAGVSGWVITLPVGTAVDEGDVIRIATVDYSVIGVTDKESWCTALRAYARSVAA
jgi:hypothetical protein